MSKRTRFVIETDIVPGIRLESERLKDLDGVMTKWREWDGIKCHYTVVHTDGPYDDEAEE